MILSNKIVILYRAGSSTSDEDKHKKFTLPAGTYSIDDFNVKIKEGPQLKKLKAYHASTLHIFGL